MAAAGRPPPPPRPASAMSSAETESGDGPLWNTIKRQLYKPEVTHVKRLVGESLIQKNRAMWEELSALRQIMADFEQRNDALSEQAQRQMAFCGSQHRDLLRRQASMLMQDISFQAEQCGHALEDLVPEFHDAALREYLTDSLGQREPSLGFGCAERPGTAGCRSSPPITPSTRPPSSCGLSGCSNSEFGLPTLPLGRALGLEELAVVAQGVREALEAEQESLLGLIGEQMQRFEWEDTRRVSAKACRGQEPSTTELQVLVRKMQDVAVSPSLKSLAIAGSPIHTGTVAVGADDAATPIYPPVITGGSNVRRLKALIAQRRRDCHSQPLPPLSSLPEVSSVLEQANSSVVRSGIPASFDPFFGDPFE